MTTILDHHGKPIRNRKRSPAEALQASYDVLENINVDDHWKYAQSTSAATLDTREKRQKLRDLARYEVRTNSYARGIVLKQANETIRSGPKLEIQSENKEASAAFEMLWKDYCAEIDLVSKLRTAVIERAVGGEAFCVFRANPGISSVPVDFEVYEGDQFATPWDETQYELDSPYPIVDGMRFDDFGNVTEYHRLKSHPYGNTYGNVSGLLGDYDPIDPAVCVHMFRRERPSQYRGVTELAPCLIPLAKLRRYTEATIRSAEKQARILGAIKTTMAIDDCAEFDGPIEINVGGEYFPTLPEGWGLHGFDSSQPAQGYGEFKREILHEIFSAWLIPWNLGSGDSSDYNFASGQLDFRLFYNVIDAIRKYIQIQLLDRFFKFWLEFANLKEGYLPNGLGPFDYQWHWDKREPIDPAKQASADATLKVNGLLDYQEFYQRSSSQNASDAQEKRIRYEMQELKLRREIADELGVELPEDRAIRLQEEGIKVPGIVKKDGDGDGVTGEPEAGT